MSFHIPFTSLSLFILLRGIDLWRKKVSPRLSVAPLIGGIIEYLWPTPIREPHQSSQGPGNPVELLARNISAGLLLPFAAYLTGKTFFKWVKSTPKQVALVCHYRSGWWYVCSIRISYALVHWVLLKIGRKGIDCGGNEIESSKIG